jgi:hypothetical protein
MLRQAREFIKKGQYDEAKRFINAASERNRQLELPGIEDEIRSLYKKLKKIRPKTKKVAAWAA